MILLLSLACAGRKTKGEEVVLPDPAQLLASYEAASVKGDAWKAFTNRVVEGAMQVPRQDLNAPYLLRQQAPNKAEMVMEIPGLGRFEEGFDGVVAWENNPLGGPRIKDEGETCQAAVGYDFDGDIGESQLRTLGAGECDGRPVWRVEQSTPCGDTRILSIDQQDFMLRCMESELRTGMGKVKTSSVFRNYQEFDGLLMPTEAVTEAMLAEMVITTTSVRHDVPDFAPIVPPAEIQALLAERAQSGGQ